MIAIIPARGGSKGLPGKNIADLGGYPLIAWTIAAARACESIDRVIVSTDSSDIAHQAEAFGAEVPFLRPQDISGDFSTSLDVVRHAVTFLSRSGYEARTIVLLQPTSPFRTAHHLTEAIHLFNERQADGLISIVKPHIHPLWLKTMDAEGRLSAFFSTETSGLPRQSLPSAYAPNGAIYLVRRTILEQGGDWATGNSIGYVMDALSSLDIDEPWDLELARTLVKQSGLKPDGT